MNDTTTHHAVLSPRPSDHVAEELHRYDEHLRDVNGSARANTIDRATTVTRDADVASGPRLVNARVNDTKARSTDTRPQGADIAGSAGLIDTRIDDADTWRPEPHSGRSGRARHAAFRYAHALAINDRIR